MNWNDIKIGGEVYHGIFTHWGRGIVHNRVSANYLESMFEKGNKRVLVKFEGLDMPIRLRPAEIRKTPNRSKIKEMVAIYKRRGVDAVDGGHILIIPKKK